MAQFVPKDWQCSKGAREAFCKDYPAILKLVQQRARKFYALTAICPGDLTQEGMIAALYAVDSYKPERGKRDAYITTLVDNALGMIAAESRAQCRQPYTWVKVDEEGEAQEALTARKKRAPSSRAIKPQSPGWRKVPAFDSADVDMVESEISVSVSEDREERLEKQDRIHAARMRVLAFRKTLKPRVAQVFDLRLNPPADFLVLARNLVGRAVSQKGRLPNEAIAAYLGIDVEEASQAARDLRVALSTQYRVSP